LNEQSIKPVIRAMLWMALGGFTLSAMNALMRQLTGELPPTFAQCMRYVFGLAVMLPFLVKQGFQHYKPNHLKGHLLRGFFHAAALTLFFLALPKIPLTDTTAIIFTQPMFVMIGAALILRETVSRDRWLAAVFGFAGVGLVLFPHMQAATGNWSLVMLAASPLFAASFLINKALTRHDRPEVIVLWQNITVTAYMIPLAMPYWASPDTRQWFMLASCGVLGTLAHIFMTRGFALADISVLQPLRFLDLLWASLFGFLMFGALPGDTAILGGVIILSATLWIAHREKRQ